MAALRSLSNDNEKPPLNTYSTYSHAPIKVLQMLEAMSFKQKEVTSVRDMQFGVDPICSLAF